VLCDRRDTQKTLNAFSPFPRLWAIMLPRRRYALRCMVLKEGGSCQSHEESRRGSAKASNAGGDVDPVAINVADTVLVMRSPRIGCAATSSRNAGDLSYRIHRRCCVVMRKPCGRPVARRAASLRHRLRPRLRPSPPQRNRHIDPPLQPSATSCERAPVHPAAARDDRKSCLRNHFMSYLPGDLIGRKEKGGWQPGIKADRLH